MKTCFDHLVVAAKELEQGVEYIRQQLGVDIPPGGVHPAMGTHNHLMRVGSDCFLEVIAINPDGAAVHSPRWYGLDDPFVGNALARSPRLLAWVVNTDDIAGLLKASSFPFGVASPVSRGSLNWHFGVPEDGRLPAAGFLPYIIQWHTDVHPAVTMQDKNIRLLRFTIRHPYPRWLATVLEEIGALSCVEVLAADSPEQAGMCAVFETPAGERELSSII